MRMMQPREITESFRLDRVIKSSRSGIVFRATELATERSAAIKLIAPSCPADLHICQEQFLEAMDTWRSLSPAAFPLLYDFGFTPDGSAFVVMELVEGTPLELLTGQDVRRILGLLTGAVEGLAAFAERGVHHGNLTPQNLLVRGGSDGERATVLGFGTAAFRVFMGELTGAVLASDSLEYAAPELIDPHAGLARANARSDIYSMAQVICCLLQARVDTSAEGTVSVHLAPATVGALPGAEVLRRMLVQALDPSPERRLSAWSELRVELGRVLGEAEAQAVPVEEPPAPSGTLLLPLPTLPPLPPPLPEPPGLPPFVAIPIDEGVESTQPVPSLAATARPPLPPEEHPARGEEPPEDEPFAAPVAVPIQVTQAFTIPDAGPEAIDSGYETQRTMAVPIQDLASDPELPEKPSIPFDLVAPSALEEQPLAEDPSPEVVSVDAELPSESLTPVPPVFEPPPTPPVFESMVDQTSPAALYDTDKGRISVQPVEAHPDPQDEAPALPPLPVAPLLPVTSELAEPVLEPEPAPHPLIRETPPAGGRPPTGRVLVPRRKRTLWPLWVLLALLLIGAGTLGFLWMQSQKAEQAVRSRVVPPTPRPPTPVPTRAPEEPPAALAHLLALEDALAAGDLKWAQQESEAITTFDEEAFSAADREHLQKLRASYADLRSRSLGGELSRALQGGSVRPVQRIMGSLSREDQRALAKDADSALALEEARRVVNIQRLAQNAERSGSWADLLQQANALREVMPKAEQVNEWRERAARGLETDSTAAAQAGNYQQAIELLVALQKGWPDRPGVQARIDRLRADQDADQKLTAALAQAEQTIRQQQPEKGLTLLQSVRAPARLEGRVAELRQRLETQLRQVDVQPPKVELQRGVKLEYEKGKSARIPFVLTDDHGIKAAKVFARVEGAPKYSELSMTRGGGNEWIAEIPAAFHKNETVQFFVVVTDHSEQVGVSGSADRPMVLKRKKVMGIF